MTSVEEKLGGTPDAVVTGFVLSTRRVPTTLGVLSLPAYGVVLAYQINTR